MSQVAAKPIGKSLVARSQRRGGSLLARATVLTLAAIALLAGCATHSRSRPEDLWIAGTAPEERARAFDAAVAFVDEIDDRPAPADAATRERAFAIVHERLHDPDVETRRRAARTLVAAGYEAKEDSVRALYGVADDADPWVRAYVAAGIGFATQRKLATPEMRRAQPERIRGVITLLDGALADPDPLVRMRAAQLVQWVGSDAAPVGARLIALSDDPDPRVASAALSAVAAIGWAARIPTDRLVARFADPEHDVRAAVAGVIYQQRAAAVPALVEALKNHPDDRVRSEVAEVLGDFGAAATPALPALRYAAANDSSFWVRRGAQMSLAKLEGAPSPAE